MSLITGTRLGPYEIIEPAGSGGMGEVYRAHDVRLDRDVAVKTIRGPFTERFEREARAISSLNHPNICTLHDVGEHEGSGYLVMEYIEGRPITGPWRPTSTMPVRSAGSPLRRVRCSRRTSARRPMSRSTTSRPTARASSCSSPRDRVANP